MLTVWKAIDEGNTSWDVPAYNGGLFSRDPETNPAGAALADMHLTDAEFGPALRTCSSTLATTAPRVQWISGHWVFGSSEPFTRVCSSPSCRSPRSDLTVDSETKAYLPAKPGDDVMVPAGRVYIHNKSGDRKATGSYFTKQFAVEHLLDSALEPALTDHLARVGDFLAHGDEAAAAEAFFDFRVADPAMGSAHFLVAAIDRIEARFTAFLTEHPVSAVSRRTRPAGTGRPRSAGRPVRQRGHRDRHAAAAANRPPLHLWPGPQPDRR